MNLPDKPFEVKGIKVGLMLLTFYKLKTPPPPRICYAIRNRYPNVNHRDAIEEFSKKLEDFISVDENICSFESWMLNTDVT